MVFCRQYHLLVWSVFSPKLLYETSKTLLFQEPIWLFSLFFTFAICRAHCGVRKDQLRFVKSKWNTIVPRRIFLQCVHAIIFSAFVAFVAFMLLNIEEKKASTLSAAHRLQSSHRQPKLSLWGWSLIPVVSYCLILRVAVISICMGIHVKEDKYSLVFSIKKLYLVKLICSILLVVWVVIYRINVICSCLLCFFPNPLRFKRFPFLPSFHYVPYKSFIITAILRVTQYDTTYIDYSVSSHSDLGQGDNCLFLLVVPSLVFKSSVPRRAWYYDKSGSE